MNAYMIMMVFIIIVGFLTQGYQNKKNDIFIKISFLAMFALYGLRDALALGIDSFADGLYYSNYQYIDQKTVHFLDENFLFTFFGKFVHKYISTDYQVYCTIMAVFVMVSFYHLIRKYSRNPWVSIMWFIGMLYYINMFSILKQAMAMAILTWAFDAIMEKRPVVFYLLVLLAAGFHLPAIIFLPAYIMSQIRLGRNFLYVLAALMLFVYIFRERILNIMNDIYENGEYMDIDTTTFLGNKVIIMLLIILFALFVRKLNNQDRYYNTLLAFMGIAAVLQTFCYYNNIFERLADYYYQFSILFMALLFGEYSGKYSRMSQRSVATTNLMAVAVISVFAMWRFNEYVNRFADFYLPFKFFWN